MWWIFWLAALVLFLIVEGLTVGLVSLWFAVGALAALLLSLAVESVWVQTAAFLAVSALCLAGVRPLLRRWMAPGARAATNADRLIGQEAVVTETIDDLAGKGAVQVEGQTWTARSGGAPIPRGAVVKILRIEGVKLYVAPDVPVSRPN